MIDTADCFGATVILTLRDDTTAAVLGAKHLRPDMAVELALALIHAAQTAEPLPFAIVRRPTFDAMLDDAEWAIARQKQDAATDLDMHDYAALNRYQGASRG